jgi:DNA-directed RNA polymerase subunit K/omega
MSKYTPAPKNDSKTKEYLSINPSVITRNIPDFTKETNNVYESVVIMSRRSRQISTKLKEEFNEKVENFVKDAIDNLEERQDNREQIEISRFYERMPKPTILATEEFLEGKTQYSRPEKEDKE